MSAYIFRHQSAGLLTDWIFAAPPTPAQEAAVAAICETRCGTTHPKTGETYWLRVVEIQLCDGAFVPALPTPPAHAGGEAATPEFSVKGVGSVKNK